MSRPQPLPAAPPVYQLAKAGALIARPADMPAPGPYYTCLVDMRPLAGFPFRYALYFSTDHQAGDGGIWLYLCDGDPTDPAAWISYDQARAARAFAHVPHAPAANPIYRDTVQGNGHTETPHAAIVDGLLYLSYHRNGLRGSQKTLMATSTDGVSFARIHGDADSIILDYDTSVGPGDGHTGYFRWAPNPFRDITQRFIGYSLHGGGDRYYSALWVSDDARHWRTHTIFTPTEGLAVAADDQMVIWHEMDPASIRPTPDGDYVAICAVGNRASGQVARISELYEVFLSPDGSRFTRQARRLLAVGPADAADAEELGSATSLVVDGRLVLLYVGARDRGHTNTIMLATGPLPR